MYPSRGNFLVGLIILGMLLVFVLSLSGTMFSLITRGDANYNSIVIFTAISILCGAAFGGMVSAWHSISKSQKGE